MRNPRQSLTLKKSSKDVWIVLVMALAVMLIPYFGVALISRDEEDFQRFDYSLLCTKGWYQAKSIFFGFKDVRYTFPSGLLDCGQLSEITITTIHNVLPWYSRNVRKRYFHVGFNPKRD